MHAMPELRSASCNGPGTWNDCMRETRPSLVSRSEAASMLQGLWPVKRRKNPLGQKRLQRATASKAGNNTSQRQAAGAPVGEADLSTGAVPEQARDNAVLGGKPLLSEATLLARTGLLPACNLGACRGPRDLYT